MNTPRATPAVCEIDNCGVLAIGRCAFCGRAFCASHQADPLNSRANASLCAPCAAKHEAEAEAPHKYLADGSARSDLLASGVKPIDIYEIQRQREPKRGFFDRGERWVDTLIPLGRGWILGEFRWGNRIRDIDGFRYVEEDWLTVLLDEPRDAQAVQSYLPSGPNEGLFPVRPCPGGYTLITRDAWLPGIISPLGNALWERDPVFDPIALYTAKWEMVKQAVRQLIGEPS